MRPDLPPLPDRMKGQPEDARGFPVPWFVAWKDGAPIFQAADARKWAKAVKEKRCWLCGKTLGVHHAFVIGPMCGVNRVTAEPPSHRECAEYALKACPFLSSPAAKRTTHKIPEEMRRNPGGEMIERNPGVSLLWVTKSWKPFRVANGHLIDIGPATECVFYREGRLATKDEALEAVSTGLPLLQAIAEEGGELAVRELGRQVAAFSQMLDATFDGEGKR